MNLRQQLIEFEGWKNMAYPDPLTHAEPWTIGVGHTGPEVVKGLVWTDEIIGKTLDVDIAKHAAEVKAALPWFDSLNEPRKAVLIGMCFQMGLKGLLGFKRTLASVRDERYEDAAEGMRRSLWGQQTPRRAHRLSVQMARGEWQ